MPSPAITITGLLQNFLGVADATAGIRIRLAGYGSQIPRIVGTSILADLDITPTLPGDGTFSFTPWGNDVITPGPNITYYVVTFIPSSGGVAKSIAYQFVGSGSFDLSTLAQFNPGPTPAPPPPNAVVTNPPGNAEQDVLGPIGAQLIKIFANGDIQAAEGIAPAGIAGSDLLYADSTAHRWNMKNNNGAADTIVGAATVDTLTNKTLTAPVITNPSTTGTDSGVETLQNKTLTAPVITNPSTTGTDSGVETLQNKTLNGSGNANSLTLINQQGVTADTPGNSVDQVLYTFTIQANTVGQGKGLRVTVRWIHDVGTASVAYKIFVGGNAVVNQSSTGVDNGQAEFFQLLLFNNAGVQNSQNGCVFTGLRTVAVANVSLNNNGVGGITNPNANFANAVTIQFTFNVANTDKVIGAFFLIELIA